MHNTSADHCLNHDHAVINHATTSHSATNNSMVLDPTAHTLLPHNDVSSAGVTHYIGIGGAGMSVLAEMQHERGGRVQGSDQQENAITKRLRGHGITVWIGQDEHNLDGVDTVVYSSAIKPDNPEIQAALLQGLRLMHRSDMLSALMHGTMSITVAGAHGKSTTSALLAHIATHAQDEDHDPSYAIGASVCVSDGRTIEGGHAGCGDMFIAEADESDGSFLKYRSSIAVVTNIEADHLDHYGTLEQYRKAFVQHIYHAQQYVVLCADDAGVRSVVNEILDASSSLPSPSSSSSSSSSLSPSASLPSPSSSSSCSSCSSVPFSPSNEHDDQSSVVHNETNNAFHMTNGKMRAHIVLYTLEKRSEESHANCALDNDEFTDHAQLDRDKSSEHAELDNWLRHAQQCGAMIVTARSLPRSSSGDGITPIRESMSMDLSQVASLLTSHTLTAGSPHQALHNDHVGALGTQHSRALPESQHERDAQHAHELHNESELQHMQALQNAQDNQRMNDCSHLQETQHANNPQAIGDPQAISDVQADKNRQPLSDLRVDIQLPGDHNIRNTTAAIIAACLAGINPQEAARCAASFVGAARRFQLRGIERGVRVIDDYAHHPTEVDAVITAVKRTYPHARVHAIFQPHLFSRTQRFAREFADALSKADEAFVTSIYPARETQKAFPNVTADIIVQASVHSMHDSPSGRLTADKLEDHHASQSTRQLVDHLDSQITNQSANQPTDQLDNQPTDQSTKQSIDQMTCQLASHVTNQTAGLTANQPDSKLGNQQASQLTKQSADLTTSKPVDQLTNKLANKAANKPTTVRSCPDKQRAAQIVASHANSGDIVLLIGAGDITHLAPTVLQVLGGDNGTGRSLFHECK